MLRQALKLKPSLPNTDVLLAMSLSELGHYEEALPDLEKAWKRIADLPLKRLTGLQLLRAYTDLRRDSDAMEIALALDRQFPDDPEILYHSSRIYANFAYLTLHKLSEVAPTSVWTHQAAGEAQESQGNYDLAIAEYRQVLSSTPTRRGIHYRIGRALLLRGRSQRSDVQSEALGEFQLELQLDPTNANAAYEIGELHRKSGQFEQAREYFTKALEYYPDFEEAQVGLGAAEIALNKPERAIPVLQKATASNPEDEVAFYRLGQAYKAVGSSAEQQRAMAEFSRLRTNARTKGDASASLSQTREVTKQEIDSSPTQ